MPLETIPFLMLPRRWGYEEMGTMYHAVRSTWVRGVPLVAYNSELDRKLDTRVTNFVRAETSAIRNFNEVARKYSEEADRRPIGTRPHVDISLDISITSPMLTTELLDSWEADQKMFQRQTQNCYIQTCEDFR